ncbi:hypothetical protein BABINDRAFT_12801 [Babjeviella inositovora NRRL Y-12698]|uniref:ER membrane protein complex subunit 6 n=1 Tax=Babjeviella inositovora NRRL Y-12698 TaxID=984486 RepID=A0A1E3QSM5_9ASCO|nr:uncharacterized protein BABINDRAFT_12801 [Babjeviella inositovora NRRL Y-12698]ODQ80670.1 hypothetical protein BABINDRAFT_12801 [Babjeviella inositovora NRRL Y-12698]
MSYKPDTVVKYGPWIQLNQKSLQHIHDIASLGLGTAAGILRLESLWGFALFLGGMTAVNGCIWFLLTEGKPGQYFENPQQLIFLNGLGSGVAGYAMMWCLVSALVD